MEIYEYAIIRLVPRVEREEFVNIGVVVFCKRKNFLEMKYRLEEGRLKAFDTELDLNEIKSYLKAWEKIIKGDPAGGAIAMEEAAYRFRWITAPKSTIIQCSKVHPGLTDAPEKVIDRLLLDYV